VRKKFFNVRGTSDFKPSETLVFQDINQKSRDICQKFGYEEISLPILEERELFLKGVGEVTDIVERQMFKIEGKDIVLRPEGTAQVIRYYLQNSLFKQNDFYKFFYQGPMFRGERPQKGRLRQFHHIGVEAIGSNSIYIDAEIISLCFEILKDIGVTEKELKINTLGCISDKEKFSYTLKQSLSGKRDELCEDCAKRLEKNPLRVIDCKNKQCKNVVNSLNLEMGHLCLDCKTRFNDLLSLLKDMNIKHVYSPHLVRGLDYYTNTVFEITSNKLGSQDAIGAGGRYNNLMKSLGGPEIPAIGFALGVERILLILAETQRSKTLDFFVAVIGQDNTKLGFGILRDIREAGFSADFDYKDKSLKGQMREAQKKGTKFVLILGEEEHKNDSFVLRNMETSTQEIIKYNNLTTEIKKRMKSLGIEKVI